MGKKDKGRKRGLVAPAEDGLSARELLNGPPNKQKKQKKHFERRVARDGLAQLEGLAAATAKAASAGAAAPSAAAPAPAAKATFDVESHWPLADLAGDALEAVKLERKACGVVVRGAASTPAPLGEAFDWASTVVPQPLWAACGAHLRSKAPTAVQRQAWPAALRGLDVLAIAPTGSGKTLAYLLPACARVAKAGARDAAALVVVPTRELAAQVHAVSKKCAKWSGVDLGVCVVAGGAGAASRPQQFEELRRSSLAVATPGRLLDLALSGAAKRLDAVKVWVVDEADRMLQLGFEEQLDDLAKLVPVRRQTLLFTATFPQRLRAAADRYVGEASRVSTIRVNVSAAVAPRDQATPPAPAPAKATTAAPAKPTTAAAPEETTAAAPEETAPAEGHRGSSLAKIAANVRQQVHVCATHKRPRLLLRFLERFRKEDAARRQASKVLVFVNTAAACGEVVDLVKRHYKPQTIATLHGKLPQRDRDAALLNFRAGKTNVLVATDVATGAGKG